MNSNNEIKIYDFLYLDFERIRSYSAQLFGGVTDSKTHQSHSSEELEGSLHLIKGKVNYLKSESETKSLHHKLYLDVENELQRLGKIHFINSTAEDDITLPFVKFTSNLQVFDYALLVEKMQSMYALSQNINKITRGNNQKQIDWGMSKSEFENMLDAVQNMYGDLIKLHFIKDNIVLTQVTLQPDLMQQSYTELITNKQNVLRNDWICVAQFIKKESVEEGEILGSPGLSQIDNAMNQMMKAINEMHNVINTRDDISIVPIAIYREL